MNKVLLLLSIALMPGLEALSLANALTGAKKGIMTRAQATQRAAELEQAMPDGLNDFKPYMLTLYIRSQEPKTKAEQAALRRLVFGSIKAYGFDIDLMTAALEKGLMHSFDEIKQLAQRHVDGIKKYHDQHRNSSSHDQLDPVQYTELIKNRFTVYLFQKYNVNSMEELLACVDIPLFKNVCQLYDMDLDKTLTALSKVNFIDRRSAQNVAIIKNFLLAGEKVHSIESVSTLFDITTFCSDHIINDIITKRIKIYVEQLQSKYDRASVHRLADFHQGYKNKMSVSTCGVLAITAAAFQISPKIALPLSLIGVAMAALNTAGFSCYIARSVNLDLFEQKRTLMMLNNPACTNLFKMIIIMHCFHEF